MPGLVAAAPQADRATPPLPPQASPCLGRVDETATIRSCLLEQKVRLLTLIGPAGVGKTRLAVHVAGALAADFASICWLDLTTITDADAVLSFIGEHLAPSGPTGLVATDDVADNKRVGDRLFILDNFEHVLAAAPAVDRLLATTPNLTVLVTSRAALHSPWEHLFPVAPLRLPRAGDSSPSEAPAVALFVQRVQALQPAFRLTSDNADAVAEVVARLDGIPLLIEFAAAQCAILTPQALLPLLEDPLDLLTSRWTGIPERHRSLRQALDWSWRLLAAVDQALLTHLTVFVDSAPLDAIRAVCAGDEGTGDSSPRLPSDILRSLASLVDQSMLQRADDVQGEPRFRLLHSLRAYAQAHWQDDETVAVHRRHAAYFLSMAEKANAEIHQANVSSWVSRPEQATEGPRGSWLERLDRDMGNMRAAHTYLQSDAAGVEQRLRLATALDAYWTHRGELTEGRSWLEAALAAGRDAAVADQLRANALYVAGKLAEHQGDYAAARRFLTESITLLRATGDQRRLADALSWNACVSSDVGTETELRAMVEESFAIYQALDDLPGTAKALNFLGELARLQGDYERAADFYQQSLNLNQRGHNPSALAIIRHNLGYIAQHQRDYTQAAALFSDALALYRDYDDRRLLVICLAALAAVATIGRPDRAAQLFAAAEAHLDAMGMRMQPADLAQHQRNVAEVRAALDEQAFQRAWDLGRAMSLEQALALVQEPPPVQPGVEPAAVRHAGPSSIDQVTAREREVAALIAQGLTNRQIALRLVIAERTVDKHVGNMLAKLGFASRAQIAAWAATGGTA